MKRAAKITAVLSLLGVVAVALSASSPDTTVGYVARQGWFQVSLLRGRVPLTDPIVAASLTDEERHNLALVADIRAFAQAQGFAIDGHYTTINPTWDRTIWNVSACDPVSFTNATWWFPIVGRVPYLGYFREEDADRRMVGLREDGLDVYKRTAGAYSTLGWFNDPILPAMLSWPEERLASTLLHELAHVTLWIPGSVDFNESFASFVGDAASERWMVQRYGGGSPEVAHLHQARQDREAFNEVLVALYRDLDAVYGDGSRTREDKLQAKEALIDGLPARVAHADLHQGQRYLAYVAKAPWNNARLAQFRTYSNRTDRFEALFEQQNRAFPEFFAEIQRATSLVSDPYDALEAPAAP